MKKLFSTTCLPASAGSKQPPFLGRFAKDEAGNVTITSLAFLGALTVLAGVSWDLNSHEYHRVKIQHTADRAVLAAADLDQTLDPQAVVNDYFEKVGYSDLVAQVNVEEGLNFRTVSVLASGVVEANTIQGNFQGTAAMGGNAEADAQERAQERRAANLAADAGKTDDEILAEELAQIEYKTDGLIGLNAFAEAEERVNNVEISMVLDISGSMGSGSKMSNLRDAANTFVDAVVNESTTDLVSVSVVPYSEHVSAGPALMAQFDVDINNPYSHCLEFSDSDFNSAKLDRSKTYDQVQHFQWGYNGYNNDVSNPVCPIGQHEDIVAFSQDTSELKGKISELEARGSTSIFTGMKWAVGLLDPDFQEINAALANDGVTDTAFITRPAAYDDYETLKTVILMTDGQNHYSYRINDNYYATASHAAHWNRYNLNWYLYNYVSSYRRNNFKYLKYWPDYGDTLLNNVCDSAKDKNIVIWSIGFEVSDHGADVMENCASSPSHFFRVEGVEIKEAFSAIARQINQLRLTQ
jgi:hypothetical protein